MTDLRKEAREIVAVGCGCDRPCGDRMSVLDCGCLNDADKIIALCMEEAARCAESHTEWNPFPTRQDAIAAAIRALATK